MNEHQLSPDTARSPSLSSQRPEHSLQSDNLVLLDRWDEGIREWGHAFVAYTKLGGPELHTPDVLTHFEKCYYVTLDSMEAIVEDHLKVFGLEDALRRFRQEQSLAVDMLVWDYEVIVRHLNLLFEFVESGGRIHVFGK